MKKDEIRRKASLINSLDPSGESAVIVKRLGELIDDKLPDKIFIYVPKKREPAIFDIVEMISEKLPGCELYIPFYDVNSQTWRIAYWKRADEIDGISAELSKLVVKNSGVLQQKNAQMIYDSVNEAGFRENDICIVPGLAFTRQGDRIGYGGGNYDRYLAGSSAFKVGVSFGGRILSSLNAEPHDVKMDVVISGLR